MTDGLAANASKLPRARRLAGLIPALGAGLLPVGICPACWPIYAGLASALGLGFLLETQYLLPITGGALLVALGALAFRANRRRGYGPLALGAAASDLILVGKFAVASDPVLYGALAALVGASIWNSWPLPRVAAKGPGCPNCVASTVPTHGS